MDFELVEFLSECGAKEYVPLLARNNIRNFNDLLRTDDDDLRAVNIEQIIAVAVERFVPFFN